MADAKVAYNYLGKTGVRVSNMCLGAMTFGDSVSVTFYILSNNFAFAFLLNYFAFTWELNVSVLNDL